MIAIFGTPPGLIPARAGTTSCTTKTAISTWAHPRSRGDHCLKLGHVAFTAGSSPLARGPLRPIARDTRAVGLIPARAGTTYSRGGGRVAPGAHPRSRGDHFNRHSSLNNALGSSPLARGPPYGSSLTPGQPGLIPARAGTTGWRRTLFVITRAHPRSRGDHRLNVWLTGTHWGSSPLARGPPVVAGALVNCAGLIPARAGTTRIGNSMRHEIRAHPRSRGDHLRSLLSGFCRPGSSPLARGPPGRVCIKFSDGGLIPARAGTTPANSGRA